MTTPNYLTVTAHEAAPNKCPECGKTFYLAYGVADEYAYKEYVSGNLRCFCTYGCLRGYQKKHPRKPGRRVPALRLRDVG